MNNFNIWVPIAIILIVYVVSSAVIVYLAKKNKEKKTLDRIIKGYIICNVCGNEIPENAVECPYCHQLIRKNQ
jgi:tRNA(Ser,Leu) C12 N-acetylase TAN1